MSLKTLNHCFLNHINLNTDYTNISFAKLSIKELVAILAYLLTEDGGHLLQEDGISNILTQSTNVKFTTKILTELEGYLLQEDNISKILKEK